jgi:anti-sigma regulatory factor (Ser/Thr protein kinase)
MTHALACRSRPVTRSWPGRLDNVPHARHWLRDRLDAESAEVRDTAETIVAELVANTLRHTRSREPGGEFTVAVDDGGPWLLVAVTDDGAPTLPRVREPGTLPEEGMGMLVVQAMALTWGYETYATGRTTWATIARAGR